MKKFNLFFIPQIIILSLVVIGFFALFLKSDTSGKIIFAPFLLCITAALGKAIAGFLNNEKIAEHFTKLYIVTFLTFWFGFLIFWDYTCIKSQEYGLILFSLIFWLGGIMVAIKTLFKND